MRLTSLALLGALGLSMPIVSAHAAPVVPAPATPDASNIIQVAGGCGAGFHRDYRGYCVGDYHQSYAISAGPTGRMVAISRIGTD
jgi:hypothetical protein